MACLALLLAGCMPPQTGDPDQPEGFTRIGDQLRAQGDDESAAGFYERALQKTPNDNGARLSLAHIYEAHGDNAAALAQYSEAEARQGDDARVGGEALRGEGRTLLKTGKPEAARDAYARALQLNDKDVKAMNGLGVALDFLGQHEEAQKIYLEALDDAPGDVLTISNLGHSYALSHRYADAIHTLEPHAHDPAASPVLRQNLAEAYALAGMDRDAERVSNLDNSATETQKRLAAYRTLRPQEPQASLGSFPTEAMAAAAMDQIKTALADETASLTLQTVPELQSSGGTPKFTLYARGFATSAAVQDFCQTLATKQFACQPSGSTGYE